MTSIQIRVNGEYWDYPEDKFPGTIQDFLDSLRVEPQSVVVELNGDTVNRSDFATTPLADGDVLEVVSFVGGG